MRRAQHCTDWLLLGQSLNSQCGVRNHLSLSELGGTTPYCRVGQHYISLCVARGFFTQCRCSQAYGCERASEPLKQLAHPKGFGGLWARQRRVLT